MLLFAPTVAGPAYMYVWRCLSAESIVSTTMLMIIVLESLWSSGAHSAVPYEGKVIS